MWLSRVAMIELADPPPPRLSRDAFLATNGCTVTVLSVTGAEDFPKRPGVDAADSTAGIKLMWPFEGSTALVGVSVILGVGPPELVAGRLRVPDEPRERAEAAIDEYADLLAVTHQCRRIVRSPIAASVAMAPAGDHERSALAGVSEMEAESETYPMARLLPTMSANDLKPLFKDRPDAVALLADAVSEPNPAARARELFRLLERAFTKAAGPLIDPLTDFLTCHPHHALLAYERDEVKHWLQTLRPETVHGDKRPLLARARDVQPYIGRMEVAAYDVVLNKLNWRRSDSGRREGQVLVSAVQPDRRTVVLLDPRAAIHQRWTDMFGRYPTDWNVRLALTQDWIWAGPGQRDGFDREALRQSGWDLH